MKKKSGKTNKTKETRKASMKDLSVKAVRGGGVKGGADHKGEVEVLSRR